MSRPAAGSPPSTPAIATRPARWPYAIVDVFEPFVQQGLVDAIVVPSGSCAGMVTHFYPCSSRTPTWRPTGGAPKRLAEVTFELTEFLVDVLGVTDTGSEFEGKLTYHASCHTLREMEVDRQPRLLLDSIEGAEFVELNGDDECCGFGGLFAIKNAEISTAMGQRKCPTWRKAEADVVTLCDVSCMTHINGMLERQGQHIRAVHIAEILNCRATPRTKWWQPPANRWQHCAARTRKTGTEPAACADSQRRDHSRRPLAVHREQEENRPRRWQDIR